MDTITVYWTPVVNNTGSWNMLYREPTPVIDDLLGFLDSLSDTGDNRIPLHQLDSKVGIHRNRATSLNGYKNLEYNMGWAFFADEPLLAKFTAPYMPTHSPTPGAILASGEFDIGQWLRPWHLDYFVPNQAGGMEFNVDDPLFYIEFKTDKKIMFKRFNRSPIIDNIMIESVQSPSRYGSRKTLSQRYSMAKKAKMQNIILNEIKNNLVD